MAEVVAGAFATAADAAGELLQLRGLLRGVRSGEMVSSWSDRGSEAEVEGGLATAAYWQARGVPGELRAQSRGR